MNKILVQLIGYYTENYDIVKVLFDYDQETDMYKKSVIFSKSQGIVSIFDNLLLLPKEYKETNAYTKHTGAYNGVEITID